jgi:hypothetical protein
MKKIFIGIFLAIVLIAIISAAAAFRRFAHLHHDDNDHDISLQIKETDNSYMVYARYDRHRTSAVQHYLDRTLGTSHMFRKSRVDATISVDDRMRFYVKNTPGRLVIRLNRNENSEEAYWRIKEVAEGLKKQIVSEY